MPVTRLSIKKHGQEEIPVGKDGMSIYIDYDWCKACDICIEFCPKEVYDYSALGQPVTSRPEDCTLCMICVHRCPDFAITIEPSSGRVAEPGTQEFPRQGAAGSKAS